MFISNGVFQKRLFQNGYFKFNFEIFIWKKMTVISNLISKQEFRIFLHHLWLFTFCLLGT
jgi:hypothetical protein